ncbi:hypothetical protein KAFR_0A02150 [Kazachstania africana CBS 2517]|uniref:Copper-fist domain-containing protein n=1 Tax=Kazachstania africana (strain ATCC 22294 / BCRC 22015 / CBS 2517 / CECT 1963 / NBRC 1671 / NRRL Y-8276) TaxID=1071382 RepID=H2AMQ3_KAZAF|nr:hypothetical protein KAFR_0A02150 [Kazachstania africana CBS 2517]CCF55653.1 hypothetical protein KAFR_0A02150 [Kazachstania africana CBS 2517]
MIIYNGEKYACASCIRGHRSSICRHTKRMLVKVRTRGRPSPVDIRDVIMVDTNSQVKKDTTDEKDIATCKDMNAQPIIFVRAKQTEKATLVDGKLNIIIQNKNEKETGKEKVIDVNNIKCISENEFLKRHSNYTKNVSENATICALNEKGESKCCSANKENVLSDSINFADLTPLDSQTFSSMSSSNSSSDTDILSDIFDPDKSSFDILTHKGIYLSTDCTCEDEKCQCLNCLIHRNEDEITSFIQQSGIPLTNLGSPKRDAENIPESCTIASCSCTPQDCLCDSCTTHPAEIIPFEKFFFKGLLNINLRKKTIIKYKGKLIPSAYWWNLLHDQVSQMTEQSLENLNILERFDEIVESNNVQLLNSDMNEFPLDDLGGFYVI